MDEAARSAPRRGLAGALVLGLTPLLGSACAPDEADGADEVSALALPPELGELGFALTVAADDEGRGRVLLSDGAATLGWFRIDERAPQLRLADAAELTGLAGEPQPRLTGLAVGEAEPVAEALVRFAATEAGADERVVRFRVADFSRPSALDIRVYPWVEPWSAAPGSSLSGPLAVVQLDEGLPELLSGSSAGLIVWDALGTRAEDYADARAALLADDPELIADDPSQGYGLTLCPGLEPAALAGGRLLAQGRRAAVALVGASLRFVGLAEDAAPSLIGAPIYACELASVELPGPAASLLVVDLDRDGHDDLLVGAPALGEVWIYAQHGEGLADAPAPTRILSPARAEPADEFGAAIAHVEAVELGDEVRDLIVVGAPGAAIAGLPEVGRVDLFDAQTGAPLGTLADPDPRAGSRHGLGVHGLDLPGREELLVSGAHELRLHWAVVPEDPP